MPESTHILYQLTLEDIRNNCGKTFTARGQQYMRNSHVLDIEWQEDSQCLSAKVAGGSAIPYTQTIRAEAEFIDGSCSCPVGYNCKHVAAVLLQWMDQCTAEREHAADTHTASDNRIDSNNNRVTQWREKLLRVSHADGNQAESTVFPGEEMLLYQLDIGQQYNGLHGINVEIIKTRLLKKGGFGKESLYRYQSDYQFPRWMTAIDRDIINIALACRDRFNYKPLSIEGNLGIPLLQKLVQSRRCYWQDDRDKPLSEGSSRELSLNWLSDKDQDYSLEATLANKVSGWQLIPASEPWYIDTSSFEAGPVLTRHSGTFLQELLRAPVLSAQQAQETANFFALHMPEEPLPLPTQPAFETIQAKPVPVLVLRSLQSTNDISDYYLSIHFQYDEYQLPFEGNESGVTEKRNADGTSVVIRRDLSAELDCLVFFNKHCPGFAPADYWDASQFTSADRMPRPAEPDIVAAEWHEFLDRQSRFTDAGWMIQQHDSFTLSFTRASDLSAAVNERNNWFDIALSLQVGEQKFQLLPLVAQWLERDRPDKPLMVQTDLGDWIQVPHDVFEPIQRVLAELFGSEQGDDPDILHLPRQRAELIEALDTELQQQGIGMLWRGDDSVRQLAMDINTFDEATLPPTPTSVKADLRDYQRRGVAWLQFLTKHGFNGILADDMGLGKTLQTLVHLTIEYDAGRLKRPALVVAPTSVLGNWRTEAKRFTPSLRTLVLHGSHRHEKFLAIEDHQIVVTSYQLLLRDMEQLKQHEFSHLILDEAQMIKNPQAKVTVAAKAMDIPHRLCLTGTPMENHLGELWSLYDFLMPGFLGTRKQFVQRYRTPIEKHNDTDKQARLNRMISMFLMRRNKDQVASELPPKTEIIREIDLGSAQAALYESIRVTMEQRVRELIRKKGAAGSHIEILEALLKLRQTCCHPQLVKMDSARDVKESAKTDQLIEMVLELIAEDKKILLFSQFTEMLKLISAELDKHGIRYVTLTGSTRKRDDVIDSFQHGDVPLFLISLKAGGTGLNLTAADTVIHYDPWWNPAVEKQASDRAHRIGQQKPVFVYKLVASDTVEEKIMLMQQRKQQLADNTYNHEETANPFRKLSDEDMLALFEFA